MPFARNLFLRASRSDWLAAQMTRRGFARRAVRRFMPGETLEDALRAAAELAAKPGCIGSLLTQLGENLNSLAEADAVRDHYLHVLDRIREQSLPACISVKPTQLGLDLSMDACAGHLLTLAQQAEATGSDLWIDMEDSSYVDRTLTLYRQVRARHRGVGIAIQAYLRRTPADVASLMPLKPTIRLVKGAYAEPPHVAFPVKRDVDIAYYDLGLQLLGAAVKGDAFPVFGTHDMPLVHRLTAKAAELGVKKDGYEIHMLYGIRSADQLALAAAGQKVKTLISYGSKWFAWYMRRLAERPANVWFAVRGLVAR